MAGVDLKVGLYASFSIAVVTAFLGGRKAMISAATASTAVLMITLVRDHGLQYLFAATILLGPLQAAAGAATYYVTGQVFFASASGLIDAIEYQDVPSKVRIDVRGAHFRDVSSISALDDIVLKLRRHGAHVEVGLNQASEAMVNRFATHHRADVPVRKMAH